MKCRLVLFLFVTHLAAIATPYTPTYREWKKKFTSMRFKCGESSFLGKVEPTYQDIFTLHLIEGVLNEFTLPISSARNNVLIQIKGPHNRMRLDSFFFCVVNLDYFNYIYIII